MVLKPETNSPATQLVLGWRLRGNPGGVQAQEAAYREVAQRTTGDLGPSEAVTYQEALKILTVDVPTLDVARPSVDQVLAILKRFGAGFHRWRYEETPRTSKSLLARWEVENEYHVQDILYVFLTPFFPDLKNEEWLASTGNVQPRADLTIPSLRLLIEVKYLRSGERMSEMLRQIGEDKSFYLGRGSPYDHILVFLCDDSARTEEHAIFEQGVRELGLIGAAILPRPARMIRRDKEPMT